MFWKRFLLTIVFAGLVIVLVGCNMPASTAPAPTATSSSGFPVPGTETMGLFETIATQTAMAAGGQPPVPGNPTAAPVSAETQPPQPGQTTQPGSNPPPATQAPSTSGGNPPSNPPPAQPQVVVPTATPGVPKTYTLQKGEYGYCIARRFNVNPSELLSVNGLGPSTMLQPGTTLTIPQTGNQFPGGRMLHSHPTTYTVNGGDTIFTIACYFGDVDPYLMAEVNGIGSPYNLSSGQTLQVP